MTGLLQAMRRDLLENGYFFQFNLFPIKKFMNYFSYNLQIYYGIVESLADSVLHVRCSLKSFVILRHTVYGLG